MSKTLLISTALVAFKLEGTKGTPGNPEKIIRGEARF
jgi:hypothetical protein